MNARTLVLLAATLVAAPACSKGSAASSSTGTAPARRFGDAMSEVGRRFERAGRAVTAGRWDFATYDLGEIEEVFEGDLPHAERPEDVPIDPTPIAAAFATNTLPPLLKAAQAHDRAAFDAAFAEASRQCNACHQAAAKPFVVVPSVPGESVPDLSPLADTPPVDGGAR